jgi:hypothetical protein
MKKILTLVLILQFNMFHAQNFYDPNTIQKIEVHFSQPNWDYMMDTANASSVGYYDGPYIMAEWIKINGIQFDSVGAKYKGNSSYNPNQVKNPWHISLDEFKDQNYQGYTEIKLSNCFKDPSFTREVLSYSILRKYMDAPLSNYAQLFVNGQYIGLYVNDQSVDKKFLEEHFFSNNGSFFKCNPSGQIGSSSPSLEYLGSDSTNYSLAYEIKSDNGWNDLINLCDTLVNHTSFIENVIDVDRAIWMLAFDNLVVNLDSYIGQPRQNYYLYKDGTKRFVPVKWDFNESFGSFEMAGTGPPLSTSQLPVISPFLHSTEPGWPLIKAIISKSTYKRMYIAHMRTIINENFTNNWYITQAEQQQSLIDTAVQSDINKLYSYSDFQNNLYTNTSEPGITSLMTTRLNYLQGISELQATPPVISNIQVSNPEPEMNSNVFVTTMVSTVSTVMLGCRYLDSQKFKRIPMFDDGLHGDGIAGDYIYGTGLDIISPHLHYYIYAENSTAGVFSPARAEHEFYVINTQFSPVNQGDLVINEICAINNSIVTDQDGKYEDWIELYNNSVAYLSLKNLHISDSYQSPLRWKFPDGAIIEPGSYLIIWADNDTTEPGLHANFSLSGSGENLILAYDYGYFIDDLTFPAQQEDITYGRYPNGTGTFQFLSPTFNATNIPLGIDENENSGLFDINPNPVIDFANVIAGQVVKKIEVFNIIGEKKNCKLDKVTDYNIIIDFSGLDNGLYLIRLNDQIRSKVVHSGGGN